MGTGTENGRARTPVALLLGAAALAALAALTEHGVRASGSTAAKQDGGARVVTPPSPSSGARPSPAGTTAPAPAPSARVTGDRDVALSRMARGKVITGATTQRVLLFTFDDGPHAATTPRLLDILDREQIKAVFFVVAHRIRTTGRVHQRQREILQDIVRRGHFIANHSVTHRTMPALDPRQAAHEMNEAARLIELVTGARPWLFRPPGGGRSRRIDQMLESAGYTIAMWNLGTGDPFVRDARSVRHTFGRVLDRRTRNGSPGGVILLHDTHSWSVDAVPMIIADVRRRNCELIAAATRDGGPAPELYVFLDDPTPFFVARAAGDPPGVEAPPATVPAAQHAALQTRERERARAYCASAASSRLESTRPSGASE